MEIRLRGEPGEILSFLKGLTPEQLSALNAIEVQRAPEEEAKEAPAAEAPSDVAEEIVHDGPPLRIRDHVVKFLTDNYRPEGYTISEIGAGTGIPTAKISPRLLECVQRGDVVKTTNLDRHNQYNIPSPELPRVRVRERPPLAPVDPTSVIRDRILDHLKQKSRQTYAELGQKLEIQPLLVRNVSIPLINASKIKLEHGEQGQALLSIAE